MSIAIYMFHAIGDLGENDWADPLYCFSEKKFKTFLDGAEHVFCMEDLNQGDTGDSVVMTFDDGHISNYWAGKFIAEQGYGSADFFINPAHIGKDYYMNWNQVLELSSLGMSIQSHGFDHRYLSELTDIELREQLLKSKNQIEEYTKQPVKHLSPPGGRYDKRCLEQAKIIGYQSILSSQPGIVENLDHFLLPRISVKKSSRVDELLAMNRTLNPRLIMLRVRYQVLKLMKFVLGNKRYESIRWYLLGVRK